MVTDHLDRPRVYFSQTICTGKAARVGAEVGELEQFYFPGALLTRSD